MKIIKTALAAAAMLSLFGLAACSNEPVPLEEQKGYTEAHDAAALYCTLGGVVPGMTSLYDPEYLACVDVETKARMEEDK